MATHKVGMHEDKNYAARIPDPCNHIHNDQDTCGSNLDDIHVGLHNALHTDTRNDGYDDGCRDVCNDMCTHRMLSSAYGGSRVPFMPRGVTASGGKRTREQPTPTMGNDDAG